MSWLDRKRTLEDLRCALQDASAVDLMYLSVLINQIIDEKAKPLEESDLDVGRDVFNRTRLNPSASPPNEGDFDVRLDPVTPEELVAEAAEIVAAADESPNPDPFQVENEQPRLFLRDFINRLATSTSAIPRVTISGVEDAMRALTGINAELDAAHAPVTRHLQEMLDALEGKSFESFEESQRIAAMIQEVVSRLGMALVCPREGCGQPAKLRCIKPARSKNGAFQFEHFVDGRRTTHGGSSTFPKLTLIPQPADQRKKVLTEDAKT